MYLVVAVVINRHKNSPTVVSVSMMIIQVKIRHSLASRPRDPSALLTATQQVTVRLAGNITVIRGKYTAELASSYPANGPDLMPYNECIQRHQTTKILRTCRPSLEKLEKKIEYDNNIEIYYNLTAVYNLISSQHIH
jgi:hypothetical protein